MAVESVSSNDNYSLPEKSRVPKKELDRNDFLNLMMKQLQNQNPLEPQSNEEFIASMAQFNSLQSLSAIDKNTQYSQAMGLIGKSAVLRQLNKEPVVGIIQGAGIIDSQIVVHINGFSYSAADIVSVTEPAGVNSSGLNLLQAAVMIGKEVSITEGEETVNGIVEKVGLENGSLKIYMGGLAYDISNITEIKSSGGGLGES